MKYKNLVLIDLFSGTGGFPKGLYEAGFIFKKHYFSEIDKYAIANYRYNFKTSICLGAIENIKKGKIEKPNVVTFGSPCQDLSIAGKRKGIQGKKSRLFFEAIRVIDELKPGIFIFENVRGLLSSNKGKDFEIVLQSFADLGLYDIQWQLLNTAWFLPQNRERLYLVGTIRNKPRPSIFPIGENDPTPGRGFKNLMEANISPTIHTQVGADNTSPYVLTPRNDSKGSKNSRCDDIESRDAKRLCIVQNADKIRRLTPLECERLQDFPDSWTEYGNFDGRTEKINNQHRYRLCGNAVSIPVVKAIGLKIRGMKIPNFPCDLGHTSGPLMSDIAGIESAYIELIIDYMRIRGKALQVKFGLTH